MLSIEISDSLDNIFSVQLRDYEDNLIQLITKRRGEWINVIYLDREELIRTLIALGEKEVE